MEWHGYPQDENAHQERPWWRKGTVWGFEGPEGEGWVRRDGSGIVDEKMCRGYEPREDGSCGGCWHKRWVHTPEAAAPDFDDWNAYTVEELMARIDREHPLPPPEPRCGQVWVFPDVNQHDTVQGVSDGKGYFISGYADTMTPVSTSTYGDGCGAAAVLDAPNTWPPPGGILVAGPDAPWADTSGGDDEP